METLKEKLIYIVQDAEAGNLIDEYNTLHEAEKAIVEFETEDKLNGCFSDGFYEINVKAVE